MKSIKARKQRKSYFNAPLHQKRKNISSHLEENLLLKYDRRRITVVKGDTVKVMRGAFKGNENKVTRIYTSKNLVEVEGITLTKADGKKVAKPIHPSNLLIIKLNLTDKLRRKRLEQGLSETTKKEIEAEAKIQQKELAEERKRQEELIKAQEAEIEQEETEELNEVPKEKEPETKEEIKEPVKKEGKLVKIEEKPVKKQEKTATKPKKSTKKPEGKKQKTTKKEEKA